MRRAMPGAGRAAGSLSATTKGAARVAGAWAGFVALAEWAGWPVPDLDYAGACVSSLGCNWFRDALMCMGAILTYELLRFAVQRGIRNTRFLPGRDERRRS